MSVYYELMNQLDLYFQENPTVCVVMFIGILALSFFVGYARAYRRVRFIEQVIESICDSQAPSETKMQAIETLIVKEDE